MALADSRFVRTVGAPVRWWIRSLPLRVVSTTFLASVLVLVLGGLLLMQQAAAGVLASKKQVSVAESVAAIDSAQRQLYAAGVTSSSVTSVLTQLAVESEQRGTSTQQYHIVVRGPVSDVRTAGVSDNSVPQALRDQVTSQEPVLVTPTLIEYTDGRAAVPGYAVGATLFAPGAGRYPIFFLFPLTEEVRTLDVLQNASITTGLLLTVLLTLIAALVARQVVSPVRAARRAAERLADGFLDDRMVVKGQDDLARLAISMNHMASELQKQISQLEELSRVQQRFVSDVSHELRTPLTTVRMASEMLYEAREDFDPLSQRSAELLQTELDRFEALLSDLLEISRFDAGAAVLNVEEVDLVNLTEKVVSDHAALAVRAGTPINLITSGPCPAEIDRRRVTRILRNLVVNAIEHSDGQRIDIFVESDADAVAVAVRDHGVGFEAVQAKQVFHRFWRADASRARTVGGTGLGLAISMEDANLHGGWLNAWGRPGQGAQFRLTLPRVEGGILQMSPLPVVPRDLVAVAGRPKELGRSLIALAGPESRGAPESRESEVTGPYGTLLVDAIPDQAELDAATDPELDEVDDHEHVGKVGRPGPDVTSVLPESWPGQEEVR
ncbi:MAG: HAMP domain-containing histidine kinase [Propionibacteriales bacterium]|nr:HAMP domain-containing histidine kinase [Propionibacteriales bacterium]